MRIIAGKYRGRTIRTVNDLSVRPATDRVRQTIYDMLATRIDLSGATVLDLFAGSGSVGLEALSRGADHVTFVEAGREAVQFLEKNVEVLGCGDSARICEDDALNFLALDRGRYDVVFADPPYAFERTEELPSIVFRHELVKPGGYLLIEHAKERNFGDSPLYTAGPVKKFGRTLVTFFQAKKPS